MRASPMRIESPDMDAAEFARLLPIEKRRQMNALRGYVRTIKAPRRTFLQRIGDWLVKPARWNDWS